MPYAVKVTGDKQRPVTQTGKSRRCFAAGMAAAYDDAIETIPCI